MVGNPTRGVQLFSGCPNVVLKKEFGFRKVAVNHKVIF